MNKTATKVLKKHHLTTIVLATVWILSNEFLRNQLIFGNIWKNHYASMDITFPSSPVNGFVWFLWSGIVATLLYLLLTKFSLKQSFWLGWFFCFVLMWLVIGNLSVLPCKLLFVAIPWSMIEVYGALAIIKKLR